MILIYVVKKKKKEAYVPVCYVANVLVKVHFDPYAKWL